MTSLRKWTQDGATRTAFLRLGSYGADEASLKPAHYGGTFSASSGVLLATTGDWYLSTDEAIDIEIKGDLTVTIGDFAANDDRTLTIDVLEGQATTETRMGNDGTRYTVTTYSGQSGTMKGANVALNAVSDAATAKTAGAGELVLYASDKIVADSGGMTRFTAGVDVSVKNKRESTYASNKLEFNMGFVNSIVFGLQAKIVAGLYTSAMVGIRTQIRPLDCKVSGNDFSYCLGKNELVLFKQENEGFRAFLLGCFNVVGAAFQEKSAVRQSQKTLGADSKGSSLGLKLAGVKSKTIGANTGVSNSM